MCEIIPVGEENLQEAAFVHAESWRASHHGICSPEFLNAHTVQRQTAYLRGELAQGKQVFLLLDPEPAAVVSVWNDLIENLYVLPEKQGMGYGSRLLQFAIEQCRKPKLWILSSNEKALRFYEARGFSLTGREHPLHDRLRELEMEWNTTPSCSL